jgi:hypothetical protein
MGGRFFVMSISLSDLHGGVALDGSDMIVTNDVLARFIYRPDMAGIS